MNWFSYQNDDSHHVTPQLQISVSGPDHTVLFLQYLYFLMPIAPGGTLAISDPPPSHSALVIPNQLLPCCSSSASVSYLQLWRGRPLFLFPCRFQVRAWRVVLDAGFLRVCPIQPLFLCSTFAAVPLTILSALQALCVLPSFPCTGCRCWGSTMLSFTLFRGSANSARTMSWRGSLLDLWGARQLAVWGRRDDKDVWSQSRRGKDRGKMTCSVWAFLSGSDFGQLVLIWSAASHVGQASLGVLVLVIEDEKWLGSGAEST